MAAVGRHYVQIPIDAYWNTKLPDYVIEARPAEGADFDWGTADAYVQKFLIVINPKDYAVKRTEKRLWTHCNGPALQLKPLQYIYLYHNIDPFQALPPNIKIRNGQALEVG